MGNGGEFQTIRVFFKKLGRIKYISHLDINRCVARALKRSGLPVWHTLGFNPHIYVTFALPLSLGFESECESLDFRLTEPVPMQTVADRLNAVLPEGLTVYRARPAGKKPEAICWADYEITQEFDHARAEEVAGQFAAWCARDKVEIVKKGKKGERLVDVKERFSLLGMEARGDILTLRLRAAAGSGFNLNPMLLLDTFAAEGGVKAGWARVLRTAILDADLQPFS